MKSSCSMKRGCRIVSMPSLPVLRSSRFACFQHRRESSRTHERPDGTGHATTSAIACLCRADSANLSAKMHQCNVMSRLHCDAVRLVVDCQMFFFFAPRATVFDGGSYRSASASARFSGRCSLLGSLARHPRRDALPKAKPVSDAIVNDCVSQFWVKRDARCIAS